MVNKVSLLEFFAPTERYRKRGPHFVVDIPMSGPYFRSPSGNLLHSYWSHGHRNSGFSHWKWWFSIVMLVITRGYIPLNQIKPPFSYGFPMVFLWFSIGFGFRHPFIPCSFGTREAAQVSSWPEAREVLQTEGLVLLRKLLPPRVVQKARKRQRKAILA